MNTNESSNNYATSITMDLENLQQKYSNLLIKYKQAVTDYISYLNIEAQQPCINFSADSKNVDQKCYDYIWKKAGCKTTGVVNANTSWAQSQTLNGLIYDSFLWATLTDYTHRQGCYGDAGNPYYILGVGTDGNLYSRPGLNAPWSRVNDNSNGQLRTVFTGTDGKLYATNKSNEIIYKNNWNDSTWGGKISGSCCVMSAAMAQDSTIVGVGMDNKLWSRPLNGNWIQTASQGEGSSYVTIAPNGKVFAIGGNTIYSKKSYQNLSSQGWIEEGSCCVQAITIAPDGTFIGVGTDYQLYTKSSYTDLSTAWSGPYNSTSSSCCVTSITTIVNKDYNSANYSASTTPNYKINNHPLTSIQGMAYTGTGSAGQSTANTLQECHADCAASSTCTGATFVSGKCNLRIGDSPIIPSSNDSYAIIPKGKQLLMNMNDLNNQLLNINKQISNKIQTGQPVYNNFKSQNDNKSQELLKNYKELEAERENIIKLLKEYETLDTTENENQIKITQNYYTYILLFILAIAVIFLLIKITSPGTTPTSPTVQYGGELNANAYYILFMIILLVIGINFSIKYFSL